MTQGQLTCSLQNGIPVLSVTGYYEKPLGQQVASAAEQQCREGRCVLVLDLNACEILSSPGVSTIVELAINVADNYGGRLIICGLDRLKEQVLSLVGIQTMATVAPTLADALRVAGTAG